MAYEKLYNEIYAVLSLKYLWPSYVPGFIKGESPDWVNPAMDMGMEVSQALMPEDGKAESFIEQYLGCLSANLPEQAKEFYGDRLYFYNDRFWALLPSENDRTPAIEKATHGFQRKLEKLNHNYTRHGTNSLYLYIHPDSDCESFDAEQFFDIMQTTQKDSPCQFQLVFLNCNRDIYICDLKESMIEKLEIPEKALTFLASETEKLRHEVNWDQDYVLE